MTMKKADILARDFGRTRPIRFQTKIEGTRYLPKDNNTHGIYLVGWSGTPPESPAGGGEGGREPFAMSLVVDADARGS